MTSFDATVGEDTVAAPNAIPDATTAWLDRVTRPLRVDRELQLEVRQELRSHLEDSIATLRNVGRGEADARDEAIRALGDEQTLADQLFAANRRRIRLRAAMAWGVQLVLPVVTVALILFLAASPVATVLVYRGWPNHYPFYEYFRHSALGDLPPDAKVLIEQSRAGEEDQAALAKQLVDRHPDDAAFFANYATALANRKMFDWSKDVVPEVDERKLAEALAVMAEGERREPDNAFYPLFTAQLLSMASSNDIEDPALERRRPGDDPVSAGSDERCWSTMKTRDEARLDQAMAAFHRAAGKPAFRAYAEELLTLKMGSMPTPRTLPDVSLQSQENTWALWRDRPFVPLFFAPFRATDLARAGKVDEARQLIADTRRANALILADISRELIARSSLRIDRHVDRGEARMAEYVGDKQTAETLWQRADAKLAESRRIGKATREARGETPVRRVHLGNPSYAADLTPLVRAETASMRQLVIALLSLATLLFAGVYLITGAPAWLLSPRGAKPVRLTIGLKRTARIIALGVVLPLALFLGWRWLGPAGRDDIIPPGNAALAYGVIAAVMTFLTHLLTRRAVAARAAELGMTLPGMTSPDRRVHVIVVGGVTLLLAAIAIAISPAAEWFRFQSSAVQSIGQIALIGLVWAILLLVASPLAWSALHRGWPRRVPLAGTLPRSAFPVALCAALVVALIGLPLRWAEARALRDASTQAIFLVPEMPTSPFKPLVDDILARDHLAPHQ